MAATRFWEERLEMPITVKVKAKFANLGSAPSSPVASAGPTAYFVLPGISTAVAWPAALASQIEGVSKVPETGEDAGFHIAITFNEDRVDEFYFGLDSDLSNNLYQRDFVATAAHELAHGLGFIDTTHLSGPNFGANYFYPTGIYQQFLLADPYGLYFYYYWDSLYLAERQVVLQAGDVYFDGISYTRPAALSYGGPGVIWPGYSEVHTGNPVTSSLSHWAFAHSYTLLLEPGAINGVGFDDQVKSGLESAVFRDIYWGAESPFWFGRPYFPPTPIPVKVFTKGANAFTTEIAVTNGESSTLLLNSATLSGAHASDFSVDTAFPLNVSAHSTDVFEVTFYPTSTGYRTADLIITYGGTSNKTIPLVGTGIQLDTDNDRISDADELVDLDPTIPGVQNPFDSLDADSISDNFTLGSDGLLDGWNDWDADGMTNEDEFTFGYNPILASSVGVPTPEDVDGDGVDDEMEVFDFDPVTPGIQNPLNPYIGDAIGDAGQLAADGLADGQNDFDADGLTMTFEISAGLNPIAFDTDGDGFGDGAELAAGYDPLQGSSSPPRDVMWIDFAHLGVEAGTFDLPFNTLGEVLALVEEDGTAKIKGDSAVVVTSETPYISHAVRIEAISGSITIGGTGKSLFLPNGDAIRSNSEFGQPSGELTSRLPLANDDSRAGGRYGNLEPDSIGHPSLLEEYEVVRDSALGSSGDYADGIEPDVSGTETTPQRRSERGTGLSCVSGALRGLRTILGDWLLLVSSGLFLLYLSGSRKSSL